MTCYFSEMHDSQRIGTWRSDAPTTVRELAARRDMKLAKNKRPAGMFGRLELRYTRDRCYSRYQGHESVST